jgi:hypothetical protein
MFWINLATANGARVDPAFESGSRSTPILIKKAADPATNSRIEPNRSSSGPPNSAAIICAAAAKPTMSPISASGVPDRLNAMGIEAMKP